MSPILVCLLTFISLSASVTASAAESIDLKPVGPHIRLFTYSKNENPQNIMVVFTKVDPQCRFVREKGQPFTDVYWLMNGRDYKPVNGLIKGTIRSRLEVRGAHLEAGYKDTFEINMTSLKDVDPKLRPMKLEVVSTAGSPCKVETHLMDGPPMKKALLIDDIYSESTKTFLPPFRKLVSLAVHGTNPETGAKETRQIAPVKR